MWFRNLSLRIAAPTILVSLVLFSLCVTAALFLQKQQVLSEEEQRENVSSVQAARGLETSLKDLIALLEDNNDRVGSLQKILRHHLQEVRALAEKEKEKKIVDRLEASMARYFACWQEPTEAGHSRAQLNAALLILKRQTLLLCVELQNFNADAVGMGPDQIVEKLLDAVTEAGGADYAREA